MSHGTHGIEAWPATQADTRTISSALGVPCWDHVCTRALAHTHLSSHAGPAPGCRAARWAPLRVCCRARCGLCCPLVTRAGDTSVGTVVYVWHLTDLFNPDSMSIMAQNHAFMVLGVGLQHCLPQWRTECSKWQLNTC